MKITAIASKKQDERRAALTPDIAKKLVALGANVCVEAGAGNGADISDADFKNAGASIAANAHDALQNADIVLTVNAPQISEIQTMKQGAALVGMLDPQNIDALLPELNAQKISAFSLELLPRISRAQAMDVLSSQSNLAGYRAVIEAVHAASKVVPMMMTAAGTIVPSKALVLGAGVAGLQAIATAKRLGAVVSAFDVRPAVKEQVQSLGAKFIEVPADESGENTGGYAKEMSEEYKAKQRQLIHDTIVKQDMVISTALIPGKPAPVLITEEMVKGMKQGSVIVDLAAASGGNCPLTEADKVVVKHGVTLIGYTNLPSLAASDATLLYAKNLYNFITTLLLDKQGTLAPLWDDELIKGTMLTHDGVVTHPQPR
jgi:NAD(P) transhydrogenase subunit alpha